MAAAPSSQGAEWTRGTYAGQSTYCSSKFDSWGGTGDLNGEQLKCCCSPPKCRIGFTVYNNGAMSCTDYCFQGWNNEVPKGSSCSSAYWSNGAAADCSSVEVPGGSHSIGAEYPSVLHCCCE